MVELVAQLALFDTISWMSPVVFPFSSRNLVVGTAIELFLSMFSMDSVAVLQLSTPMPRKRHLTRSCW